jgi:hypothetical protein
MDYEAHYIWYRATEEDLVKNRGTHMYGNSNVYVPEDLMHNHKWEKDRKVVEFSDAKKLHFNMEMRKLPDGKLDMVLMRPDLDKVKDEAKKEEAKNDEKAETKDDAQP